jgi:polyhydroxyalkanoate synthesis regulator phasin
MVRKKSGTPTLSPEELAQREAERLAKIDALEQQIEDLERSCDEYVDISLLGVQVTTAQYGVGTVIEQDVNKIKVRFAEVEKTFILDKKYPSRPRFEDDDEIVSAFTEYGQAQEQIKRLQRELAALQA